MGNYDNESYLTSLDASRGDVDRQVQNALSEVGRQSAVNQAQAAKITPAVGAVTSQHAAQAVGDNAAVAGMAHHALGSLATSTPAALQPGADLTLQALGQQQQAFQSTVPLLQQGFQEQAQNRTAQTQNIGSQLHTDIDMKVQDYLAQRAAEDRNYASQQAMATSAQSHAAQIAAQQIAAAQAEAQAQRDWASGQSDQDRTLQALLANPATAPLIPWGTSPIPTAAGRRSF